MVLVDFVIVLFFSSSKSLLFYQSINYFKRIMMTRRNRIEIQSLPGLCDVCLFSKINQSNQFDPLNCSDAEAAAIAAATAAASNAAFAFISFKAASSNSCFNEFSGLIRLVRLCE